jgi:predicted nucleic acid-binding protein
MIPLDSNVAISVAEDQIAGVAAANKFRVASRDEQPFRPVGLVVINPWRHKA